MDRLKELQSLINLSKALDQEPNSALLEEFEDLSSRQDKLIQRIKENVAKDLAPLFEAPKYEPGDEPLTTKQIEKIEEVTKEEIEEPVTIVEELFQKKETVVDKVASSITRQVQQEATLVRPDPQMPAETAALEQKVKYLENWVSRIAATGPGGGAAQIYNLDIPVKTVTGDYTINRKDYYIGVSSTVKTYITLPTTDKNLKDGRVVVVKDESGHAQLTPIAIVGTIDGDVNGAEIRINNGALQFIYRNGSWRII